MSEKQIAVGELKVGEDVIMADGSVATVTSINVVEQEIKEVVGISTIFAVNSKTGKKQRFTMLNEDNVRVKVSPFTKLREWLGARLP